MRAGMPGPMEGVVASILLQIPFIKHIFGWIGAHPAGARVRLPMQRIQASRPFGSDWHGITSYAT